MFHWSKAKQVEGIGFIIFTMRGGHPSMPSSAQVALVRVLRAPLSCLVSYDESITLSNCNQLDSDHSDRMRGSLICLLTLTY